MRQIPFTKEGLDELRTEYEKLKVDRPDAVMHLKRARELGDLSENGYYKASRAKLSFIDSRLRHLKHLLDNAVLIEKSLSEVVEIGSTIVVDDGERQRGFSIVGGFESDPSEGKISHQSPLGKALLGAKVGEKRVFETPKGKRAYTVIKVE
jgi:transcription elongation factor GreA